MRNTRIGAGICLAVGSLALAAPVAAAAAGPSGEQTIHISPAKASPGSQVTVSTRACGKETYGKGTSVAGGAFHLFAGDRDGVLVGVFDIPAGTRPGIDTVTVKCPPRIKITDTYRIVERAPSGGVDAGFGAPADHGTQLAAGSVLLAAAAAGGVVRLRRRTAETRT
ncbi:MULTISPECIES: sortase [Streptomyces]|uniref:Sortase n=1 Tax=Streptomyces glycanivorans TaxID=3033808 RepID=A0ABY9JL86_9ACTN|nr:MULTISPECIES: sortase [unclassified Streptomyces]WLQ68463.1 sortase [Streptomyces sp. Alt3]WSQ89148.1 sortase [Streptomyces sp. NBC_01212]WSR52543.1 sortase [Streptomyces sp. NBC_01201]